MSLFKSWLNNFNYLTMVESSDKQGQADKNSEQQAQESVVNEGVYEEE